MYISLCVNYTSFNVIIIVFYLTLENFFHCYSLKRLNFLKYYLRSTTEFTSCDCCKKSYHKHSGWKKKHKFILLQFLEVTSLKQVSLGQNQAVFGGSRGESASLTFPGIACISRLMAPSFLFSVNNHITPTGTSILNSPNLTLALSFSSFTPRTLGIDCIASQITQDREFPGGPVVRTSHSHCQGPGFKLWSGNWDSTSQVTWPKKKSRITTPSHDSNWITSTPSLLPY